ncbi:MULTISPECIES: cob(I)yrinic acid a,c-diamide adenosyltransferase [unclassified Aureimonas]|uniref:cob(I)yrinic acid a,c-diamide adenosyltransferase n=1 Tax=unclassified Aureimonas TaxID=2615206 RepID=UPI0006F2FF42|nr:MULTISPECIES: cob(I)yrinic acid a,c-diamide adenosyltransferase [unclassified Aureimonas]KQT53953.1 cob(I)yrinic acid a c-diamide adenosyltransferase [Aureimonas sp. Leaf427]KQT71607.1 cob(I)yrinic acid a c-diamide adenosyltransferase [Aureimonas sp. Leaf460]
MVKLNRIYTRTGDDGTTGLGSGPRRLKSDLRLEAIGTVDELNASIGLARLHANAALDGMLSTIQNDLFDLGADLATPETGEPLPYERLAIVGSQVERLEREIDAMNAELEPLKSFILPAGSAASAHLHLARTICRRAERCMVALARIEGEVVGGPALLYANRLSDHLFVAARVANEMGRSDVLWVPGASR